MRSCASLSVASAHVRRQAALGKIEPPSPEWTSSVAVLTLSST